MTFEKARTRARTWLFAVPCFAVVAVTSIHCQQTRSSRDDTVEYRHSMGQMIGLIDRPLTLGKKDTWVAVKPPIKVDIPYSLLCIGVPDGYRQSIRPLGMIAPSGEMVVISAEVMRSDGSAVPMQFLGLDAWRSQTDGGYEYCLKSYMFSDREGEGFPAGTIITGLTLRSNVPITIRRLVWSSSR